MTIYTVSQLKEKEVPESGDLFKISVPYQADSGKYASRKISYGSVKEDVISAALARGDERWDVGGLSVRQIDGRLSAIESVLSAEQGAAYFGKSPVSLGHCVLENEMPNRREVKDLIQDYSEYVTPGSYVAVDPRNSSRSGSVYSDDSRQYHWHIDAGGSDSSLAKDQLSETGEFGGVKMLDTGLLTVYGWVASGANIPAQEAWVGLFANVQTGDNGRQWVLLQVQPFVVSQYSQVAQYVGFNVPVRAGLELKVMTGFAVNAAAAGVNVGHSLMFSENMPNHFIGYVFANK